MTASDECIILANGSAPTSELAQQYLLSGMDIIACDGALEYLDMHGLMPVAVVGDLDSIPAGMKAEYASLLRLNEDQEINDLTKASRYAKSVGYECVHILGATGLRDDHTIGNISLLLDYSRIFRQVDMITNHGIFMPVRGSMTIGSRAGLQISLFTPRAGVRLTTVGLRWELADKSPESWWQCTLNEALGDTVTVTVSGEDAGAVIFRLF
jgi:thiamine pyrophosphokinase